MQRYLPLAGGSGGGLADGRGELAGGRVAKPQILYKRVRAMLTS